MQMGGWKIFNWGIGVTVGVQKLLEEIVLLFSSLIWKETPMLYTT